MQEENVGHDGGEDDRWSRQPGACPRTATIREPPEFLPVRAAVFVLQAPCWLAEQRAADRAERHAADLERAQAGGHLSATATVHGPEGPGRGPECQPAPMKLLKRDNCLASIAERRSAPAATKVWAYMGSDSSVTARPIVVVKRPVTLNLAC